MDIDQFVRSMTEKVVDKSIVRREMVDKAIFSRETGRTATKTAKPVGNVEVLKAKWNSLPAKNKENILSYIPQYVASTPEVRYRKNFENFLSERYWETHPLNTSQNETSRINCSVINENERRKRNVYQNAVKAIANINLIAETAAIPAETVVATEISDS